MLNDWHALGVAQYRKWHVYDMEWKEKGQERIILENYLVSGAPFGGPVALFPDVKRLQAVGTQESIDLKLSIYTSAGIKLSELDWNDKPVIAMGWTLSETLVTVTDEGILYTI
jgi:vacuolar protein sorting-associated protein 16